MRKMLLLLFLMHCGLMSYSIPPAMGHVHAKHSTFVFKQHIAHYQSTLAEDDLDDELEEDEFELEATPLFQLHNTNVYSYVAPARAPGFKAINQNGGKLAVPHYVLFQNFRI